MHHFTCEIISLLHSVNLIVFTPLLVHLILRISLHHSHYLRSHHLSLPRPFTPDLKLISFKNPFLHSHPYSFRTAFTDLNLYCIKGALALFVLVSFLATCAEGRHASRFLVGPSVLPGAYWRPLCRMSNIQVRWWFYLVWSPPTKIIWLWYVQFFSLTYLNGRKATTCS